MIRFASNNDINGIVDLWHEAFGDSAAEIKFFLDNKFKPENTLVFEENKKIASMLFLLDGEMCINNSNYAAYYLYAACTAHEYRGRGLMSELLKFAQKTAYERNVYFICLMPAEDSLFDYYSRFGYLPVFTKKLLDIKRADLSDKPQSILNDSGIYSLKDLRDKSFKGIDRFVWCDSAISFAFKHAKMYDGCTFVTDKGYALYSLNSSKITVKEFAFSRHEIANIAAFLFKKHNIDEITFILPIQYECRFGSAVTQKSGMLLPVNVEADELIKNVKNAYLGLTLD